MKFLVALGFFASAMALATPIKESDKRDDISASDLERYLQDTSITTGQEPEAMFLHKREIKRARITIPENIAGQSTVTVLFGVTLRFIMSEGQRLCQHMVIYNTSLKDFSITFWAIAHGYRDRTPMIGQTARVVAGGFATLNVAAGVLEHLSGQEVFFVVNQDD